MGFIMVFDTETTGLEKCFCYDIGYVIINTESNELVKQAHYIVEQVWHNLPLFESAYYKDKRPDYITLMRSKLAIMDKWGYIMQAIRRDIKAFNITDAYAYNSTFDDKVLTYNCDWFRTMNPFDTVAIHDIWGYASAFITNTDEYKQFCEVNQRFTDTGNYSGSAESVYQYIQSKYDFIEKHMGLYDAQIESNILLECIKRGAEWNHDYEVKKILKRQQIKPFTIKIDGVQVIKGRYIKKYVKNDTYSFTTAEG